MTRIEHGGIRLFRLFGITVSLHWTWFVLAAYEIQTRPRVYSSIYWNIAEYMALFLIVLIHEFGHALACKSVGGQADRILLWPLGGVAFVAPPQRPGAVLWSIAAGPLVNVILVPITMGAQWLATSGMIGTSADLIQFTYMMVLINWVLLIFNILPIYPLDGGQILRSLLWFVIGAARSLMAACVIGLVGAALVVVAALAVTVVMGQSEASIWFLILAAFGVMQSWGGLKRARMMLAIQKIPRRPGVHCPACGKPPLVGPFWGCNQCGQRFDWFQSAGTCPSCGRRFDQAACPECGQSNPMATWIEPAGQPIPALQPAERG